MKKFNTIATEKTRQKLGYDTVIELLIAECTSSPGKMLAKALLPVNNAEAVQQAQKETSEALFVRRVDPDIPLGGISDINEVLERLSLGGSCDGYDFLSILDSLYASRRLYVFFTERHKDNDIPALKNIAENLRVFDMLEKDIARKISDDGNVRDRASDKLHSLRSRIEHARQDIRKYMDHLLQNIGMADILQEKIITMRNDRFVIPVKQHFRNRMPGIVHDQSASGATVYIEPLKVVEKTNDLQEMIHDEMLEVRRILNELADHTRPYVCDLKENMRILAIIDFTFAKARLAEKMNAVCPDEAPDGSFYFKNARHPLISKKTVVPITLGLDDERRALIITGPNTGGKTVTLKTCGLFVLMNQAGLHLPCDNQSYAGLFDHVFADIGDEQSLEQSLSTFSSHLVNIREFFDHINENALVLFDELGAGTDPSEGAALATALLDAVLAKKGRVLATTHYSALKKYAYNNKYVENASVEFNPETLRPTYKLLVGLAGSSNALEIARQIGISADVINHATKLLDENTSESQKILDNLEALQLEMAMKEEALEEREAALSEMERNIHWTKDKIIQQKEHILNQARLQAADILSDARMTAELAAKEIKALRKGGVDDHTNLQGLRKKLSGKAAYLRENVADDVHINRLDSKKIKVGDTVYLKKYRQNATVTEVPNKNGILHVQAGIMKISVSLDEVEGAQRSDHARDHGTRSKVGASNVRSLSPEIDVRGKYLDEALTLVDKYLDDAFLIGLKEVQIIHGKGTGSLRKGIQEHFRLHAHVENYRNGRIEEGGDGVTVVSLK